MNRIVKVVRASELPDGIRGEIAPDHDVRLTIEDLDWTPNLEARRRWLERIRTHLAEHGDASSTSEDAVRRVRELRDEWDR